MPETPPPSPPPPAYTESHSQSQSQTQRPLPKYGATDHSHDLEANITSSSYSSSPKLAPTTSVRSQRGDPLWLAWHRERMQVLGPVAQDKRMMLWTCLILSIVAITLGVGLGTAYGWQK